MPNHSYYKEQEILIYLFSKLIRTYEHLLFGKFEYLIRNRKQPAKI